MSHAAPPGSDLDHGLKAALLHRAGVRQLPLGVAAATAMTVGRFLLVAALLAAPSASSLAQPGSVAPAIATENAELALRIAAEEGALDRERSELARLQARREQFEERLQRIAKHAELEVGGREFVMMVRGELRALPRPEQAVASTQRRELAREQASDSSVRAERAALALADMEAATARRMAAAPAAPDQTQPPQDAGAVREGLAQQRDLLRRLHALSWDRQQALREIDRSEAELVQRGATARVELTRLLFWRASPPERRLIDDVGPALRWVASAGQWRAVALAHADGVRRAPLYAMGAVLTAALLLYARAPLRRRLAALAVHATGDMGSRMADALKAIAVTLALALPFPLLLWAAGDLLTSPDAAQPFTLALSVALEAASRLLFALSACVWLLDPRGLAACHFGWNQAAVRHAGAAVRRFTAFFVPLILLAALNGLDNAPYGNRETLARLLFGAAMVALAILMVRLFGRKSLLIQFLAEHAPRGLAMRLHPGWAWALLAFPLGMLALAGAGYVTAAAYFFGHTTMTLFLLIAAGVLYGLVALWVQVQHWRLDRQRVQQGGLPPTAVATDAAGGEVAILMPQRIDLAAMGEQTRSLLDVALTLLLLVGLWAVWKDAFPALTTIGEHALWSFAADGDQPASAITLGDLFLSTVIAVVTWVAVRNVGALLDTVLLQRLEFQADANYAIKIMSRYALTAVGVVLASGTMGISWGTVHWLVAALGVGLGFGLQEIVANFVCGLIVLAERPVRIGDVVTIGTVTGTVSRIRARATVIIDADNREVIVPNKGFITERVVNWTLSDTMTRLLLPFSVAYGGDVASVQRVVLDAVRGTDGVMDEPAPSVFFVGFGDKSLNFEARAFIKSLNDLMRVRHAINAAIEQALRKGGIQFPA